jgi:integrase
MTRIRLRYVQAWVDDEGRVHRYFRRRGYPRVRLPGLPGSVEFNRAYEEALAAAPPEIGAKRTKPGSLNAALIQYYLSSEFRDLAAGTQAMRRAILEHWRRKDGDKPIALLPPEYITRMLATMEPHAARNWLKTLRHFAQSCVAYKLMRTDPTLGIKRKVPKSDGHHRWEESEIGLFEAHHPIGSKARLALALGLYTAQRRGDVIRMGRQHIRDGVISVRQEKIGAALAIPVHPDLQAILDATPIGHLALLVTKTGKSYAANDFSEQFRAWCDAAGLPKACTFHGLRKAALTRLADAGCTVHEIAAISGHKTLKEIERYTKAADQARLARAAVARTLAAGEQTGTASVKPEPPPVSNPLSQLRKKAEG